MFHTRTTIFLVSITDLPKGLTPVAKLFAADTSLFSVVHDPKTTSLSLNEDLLKKPNGLINGRSCLIQIPRPDTYFFKNFAIVNKNIRKHLRLLMELN